MSATVDDLEEVVPAALRLNDEDDKSEKRSRSSVEKRLELAHLANEDSQTGRTSLQEANGIKFDNENSKVPSLDRSIEDKQHNAGFAEERHDEEMQQLLGISGNDDPKLDQKEKLADCADECVCKIKQALGLIVEEIKKVDTAISNLTSKAQCPYTPKPDERKEFAKSVEKNSTVCHVIIGELKKQRVEIDEMLELYEVSTRDFTKMEATLNRQREKIEHIEAILVSTAETVISVKQDIAKRHENFQLEIKSRRSRVETREEILSVFLNWILSLDAKRHEEQEAADLRLKEAIEERDKDRTLLTLAVRQLQEVRKIEILLTTQRAAKTQERVDISNVPIAETQRAVIPASFCGCLSPINQVAVISGQCSDTNGCGTWRGKFGPEFNNTLMRCAGGADGYGIPVPFSAGLRHNKNEIWDSRTPFGYQKIIRGPSIYKRRVPIARRKSPTNNFRSPRKKIRHTRIATEVRHSM